jgi:UDP-N-acetylglucosamine 2-epimerase (non-hydrolysing)
VKRTRALFVFGTRPEAIKLAPVIQELRRRSESFSARICVTAQHRDMLDQVLSVFRLRPHYDLDIMRERQSLFAVTARTLRGLEPILAREQPDVLFVQGDTTTAFAAALAAFYRRVPVAHVEAGLRTYDLEQPYPEELNRRIISPIARFNFAPTLSAARNLRSERIPKESIFITGNTVIDALLHIARQPPPRFDFQLPTRNPKLILVTAHRRESFGAPLENICRALREIVRLCPDVAVVYPVHPNPSVREPVYRLLKSVDRIQLLPPIGYLPFVHLMKRSYLILSDSGGIQEEAPALGKPVLVLRDKTERPEAVRAGTARLVGTDPDQIVRVSLRLLRSRSEYVKMARAGNPFGDGRAAARIADFLEHNYGKRHQAPRPFVRPKMNTNGRNHR